ncbi:MAG: Chromosome partition protein Smc [Anaerolineales bacterium]|nr:Chromosome partition protein Smc [Anaerolineales bacterium]
MIPLRLRIAGFLSYRDPVELDFGGIHLACISGQNGAGKSSLLDAFTWSLFGEARGRGADVIHLSQDVKAAEAALTFEYEGNVYRVQRTLPRGKATVLEFQVLDGGQGAEGGRQGAEGGRQGAEGGRQGAEGGVWRPLTEKTTRETQARIEQTLRLDYETFINASFFLQGKADQFTQKKAGERKAVLSSILGLEIWETYKERTADKRKLLEREIDEIDGRMAEIDSELGEEGERKRRLGELEGALKRLTTAREAQESALENIRRNVALVNEQRKGIESLAAQLKRSQEALASVEAKIAVKESERAGYLNLLERAKEIERLYKAWQKSRKELEEWEKTALEFREYDGKRQPLLREIEVEKTKLEQEGEGLGGKWKAISEQLSVVGELEAQLGAAQTALKEAEKKIKERAELEEKRNEARERGAALKAENESLRREMDELKNRIEALKSADGAECPLCGQPLNESHRKSTLKELEQAGKERGDAFRANKKEAEDIAGQIANYELRITDFAGAENDRVRFSNSISQLTLQLESIRQQGREWEKTGAKRLKEIEKVLESGKYASEAQKILKDLDKELAKLGYDISAHEAKRKEENELRGVEEEARKLESARELNKRIGKEIEELEVEGGKWNAEVGENEKALAEAEKVLAESETNAPSLQEAESKLFELREDENNARQELGAARQRVEVLSTLRSRRKEYERQREELSQNIVQHKALERAFGKDGVPALLIEQSLPQIQQKANDILERLSDGAMTIRFVTQAEYKDKKRDDLKETLDIQISDSSGTRDYEMYSGGEAFRVNFAIRLALSEILAQRKGARLQTLVIDEGFGSQDALGRQRLVEAINAVQNDFAKIFIITHLDELKDAFPNRIEVEKTERGSVVKVV